MGQFQESGRSRGEFWPRWAVWHCSWLCPGRHDFVRLVSNSIWGLSFRWRPYSWVLPLCALLQSGSPEFSQVHGNRILSVFHFSSIQRLGAADLSQELFEHVERRG